MKRIIICITALLSISTSYAQQKTQVLVLGSYHMGNPGLDAFNMEADDVTSPKRQREIEDFVNLLATFKPTKVCVEVRLERNEAVNEEYKDYLNGKYTLSKNEIDQIGYRLAKRMGHEKVYGIDVSAPFEMDTVVKLAETYHINSFTEMLESMPAFMEQEDKKLKESTLTEFFKYINSDPYNKFSHNFYLKMVQVGKGDNYSGADLVADWYKRNLRIYRNLIDLDLKPDDRVIILYGAGHNKILQDLVEDSENLELVRLNDLP